MLNHTALLNERRANWEVDGYTVEVEGGRGLIALGAGVSCRNTGAQM